MPHTHFHFLSLYSCLVCVALCSLILHFCCISVDAAHVTVPPPALRHHLGHGIRLPVYHRSFPSIAPTPHYTDVYERKARRILDPALAANNTPANSTNVPELRSELITLGEPFGQYFAELHVGTPAKNVAVIIDTGSQLTWIQCQPCEQCGPQTSAYPIFDPAKSSSYVNVMCDADICQTSPTIPMGCTNSGACEYEVTYGDKSNSSGILAEETLTFTIAGGGTANGPSSFQWTEFVFGCGTDNVGVESQLNASGLMGLDRGLYSIISQLSVAVFSYCLPNRVNNVDVSGYLTFGGGAASGVSSSSVKPALQYTPMIQNRNSSFLSQFYYLGLTGVSVNDQLLDIPAAAFELDGATGLGGTVIDSGTTFTTFVDEAYAVIMEAFESSMEGTYKKVEFENSTRLCYELPLAGAKGAPAAPNVTLHLGGSVEMELSTDQLFYLGASDTTNNYYCLAFASGGPLASGAKNLLGNYQQQDFVVEYDLANARLGFAATQCSTTSSDAP